MKRYGAALVLWLALTLAGHADEAMEQEIDYLLNNVVSSHCVFIRNGKEHDGEAARDHLNMKRRGGKRYFSTTEEFIERLASSSSWSGKPYYISCGGAEAEPAGDWFMALLQEYRLQY